MASTSAVMATMPITSATQKKFFKPLVVPTKSAFVGPKVAKSLQVRASMKEKAVAAGISAAMTAAMVIPDVAEAASGVSPSLKNFLLSIGAGGIVLVGIIGAVVGVSNFDPVKRG